MLAIDRILGSASEPEFAERLHDLAHAGRVEYVVVAREDAARRRLRTTTDKGTDCAIALPREARLAEGAVLVLDAERAIVVRMTDEQWLELAPRDASAALELGYYCGNLHWRVRFRGRRIAIALEGPEADYLARLQPFLDDGRAVRVVG